VQAAGWQYHALLWALWVVSPMAVGVVYPGMTVSVYALPRQPAPFEWFSRSPKL
jgi:hypothetical protein